MWEFQNGILPFNVCSRTCQRTWRKFKRKLFTRGWTGSLISDGQFAKATSSPRKNGLARSQFTLFPTFDRQFASTLCFDILAFGTFFLNVGTSYARNGNAITRRAKAWVLWENFGRGRYSFCARKWEERITKRFRRCLAKLFFNRMHPVLRDIDIILILITLDDLPAILTVNDTTSMTPRHFQSCLRFYAMTSMIRLSQNALWTRNTNAFSMLKKWTK